MSNEDLEIIEEFILESREHLSSIELDLLAIEQAGVNADRDLINKVFRAAHSIKGGAGFLELHKIQELAHKVESILDRMRNGAIEPSPEVINILLLAFDQLSGLINDHANSNSADIDEISVSLTGLLSSFLEAERKPELSEQVEFVGEDGGWRLEVSQYDLSEALAQGQYVYLIEVDLIRDVESQGKRPWDFFRELNETGSVLATAVNLLAVGTLEQDTGAGLVIEILYATIIDPNIIDGLLEGVPGESIQLLLDPDTAEGPKPKVERKPVVAPPAPVAKVSQSLEPVAQKSELAEQGTGKTSAKASASRIEKPNAKTVEEEDSGKTSKVEDTLRVNVSLLETLMSLAGELVLGRNQLDDAIRRQDIQLIAKTGQRVNLITSELQEAIMQTRMQPVGNVFSKFTRVVRDLARSADKQIQLEIKGKEVELDKAILEGINDPLTHMIRNSVDHGIELPGERLDAGKPESGHILLQAYHAAGQVVIEIADDGRGMDPEKIAISAVRKGILTDEAAASMSDRDKLALIFLPGFSTAEKLTNISGRGVGMDVVKTNIDRLGGRIDIESIKGEGSMIRIFLPLTLAIMPSLLISCGGSFFAIAQSNVQELLRIPQAEMDQHIDRVGDQLNLAIRDRLLPVLYLDTVVGIPAEKRLSERNHLNIVVMQTGNMEFGLVVDQLHDTEEIVVRPLGRHLQGCIEYAGATILGNGHIAMILDAGGIAEKARLSRMDDAKTALPTSTEVVGDDQGEPMQLIIMHNGPEDPVAIPLAAIQRLEEVRRERIEKRGGMRAMQHNKRQLPLVMLSDVASMDKLPDADRYVVLVVQQGEVEYGLLGCFPVDVFNGNVLVDGSHRQPGVLGSCILGERTTLLLSPEELNPKRARELPPPNPVPALTQHPQPTALPAVAAEGPRATILLAEDSDFFRNHLRDFLQQHGFRVIACADGALARDCLKRPDFDVQLVLTDIEMPNMDGLQLTAFIRSQPKWQHLPIVAVSTLAQESDIARGIEAGVTEYQVKLDKETLLKAIERLLNL